MSNYFEEQEISTIERVVLAEDIILPEVTKHSVSIDWLNNNNYISPFNVYKDTLGKFFLPIMTPMVDKNFTREVVKTSPNTRTHKGSSLKTSSYTSSNYISLYIPKYILLNFIDKVPKGTEFIVASIGGSVEIEDMRIVGIYSLPTQSK